jgi:hypothetical protein
MNETLARQLLDKALVGRITFSEVIATITKEGVVSCHVDFLRNAPLPDRPVCRRT